MATKRHTYLADIALALGSLGASLRPRRALAITGIELVNQWYYNPAYLPHRAGSRPPSLSLSHGSPRPRMRRGCSATNTDSTR